MDTSADNRPWIDDLMTAAKVAVIDNEFIIRLPIQGRMLISAGSSYEAAVAEMHELISDSDALTVGP